MKRNKGRLYIAGAMTNCPNYRVKFAVMERAFTAKGYTVLNPAKIALDAKFENKTAEYKAQIDASHELLKTADKAYFMQGWENSTGSCLELAYCWA
ncbi:MAG: DUF4406 domain-containing protein, partial [Elusimicrobiota bacterium]|nr:DUF4406 domain-containing protein [Elusimicrobiota bacterium]